MKQYTVVVVDDHRVLIDGLVAMFEREPDFLVVARAMNGRDGLNVVAERQPDLVISDIGMSEMNGIDMCRRIREQFSEIKVLALSMQTGRQAVREMLKAGAAGYVLKSSAYDELIRAARDVLAGKRYFSPPILNGIVEEMLFLNESMPSIWAKLTVREREIAQLIVEGRSTKEISYLLEISVRTADTHKKNVFDKLNIDNVADLTRLAIREGLVDVECDTF